MEEGFINERCAYCKNTAVGRCSWRTNGCVTGCESYFCQDHRTEVNDSHCRVKITCTECAPRLKNHVRNSYIIGAIIAVCCSAAVTIALVVLK